MKTSWFGTISSWIGILSSRGTTSSWIGTTSNVEHEREPGTRPGSKGIDHYKFILLGSKQKPDGSEERFEKSVAMHGGEISGWVVNGRQVVVEGEEGKDGWIRATKIIDKSTGAVTEPLEW